MLSSPLALAVEVAESTRGTAFQSADSVSKSSVKEASVSGAGTAASGLGPLSLLGGGRGPVDEDLEQPRFRTMRAVMTVEVRWTTARLRSSLFIRAPHKTIHQVFTTVETQLKRFAGRFNTARCGSSAGS